jgi:hypothetical protein
MSRTKQRTCRGKRRFRDHAEAIRSLRGLAAVSTRQKIADRAYACDRCGGWHVSSRPDRYA